MNEADCIGSDNAVFVLEDGASLSNVIIGADQLEGIHCKGACTLKNVWFRDVCEVSHPIVYLAMCILAMCIWSTNANVSFYRTPFPSSEPETLSFRAVVPRRPRTRSSSTTVSEPSPLMDSLL